MVPTEGSKPLNAFRLRSRVFATLCKNACCIRKSKMPKSHRDEQKLRKRNIFCHQLSSKKSASEFRFRTPGLRCWPVTRWTDEPAGRRHGDGSGSSFVSRQSSDACL